MIRNACLKFLAVAWLPSLVAPFLLFEAQQRGEVSMRAFLIGSPVALLVVTLTLVFEKTPLVKR